MSKLSDFLRYSRLTSYLYIIARDIHLFITNKRFSDQQYLKRKFLRNQGYELNLENPVTLNEKLQWLKLNDRKDYQVVYADKYAVREMLKKRFGEEYLIPLVFDTFDYRDLIPENFPDYPFVIKTNHGFGNTVLVKDKARIDWDRLRIDFRRWLHNNYYYYEREWQYKNIVPRIIAEKMLITKDGRLPDDYKLNFIEGKLEFVYVSVDREGANKRNIYDPEWNPMNFTWARKGKDLQHLRGNEIDPPPTYDKMVKYGSEIASLYRYVRVDFYDVDGKLYFGEITQCHGGGFDQMIPKEYDIMFGQKLKLPVN